jgi:hypothetical protein
MQLRPPALVERQCSARSNKWRASYVQRPTVWTVGVAVLQALNPRTTSHLDAARCPCAKPQPSIIVFLEKPSAPTTRPLWTLDLLRSTRFPLCSAYSAAVHHLPIPSRTCCSSWCASLDRAFHCQAARAKPQMRIPSAYLPYCATPPGIWVWTAAGSQPQLLTEV